MSLSKRRRGLDGAFLAAVFLAALALRLLPLPAATDGGVRLLSPDCYAHLRRAALTVRRLPHVPVFDPFLNHPAGGVFIWPPLFDLLVAGVSRAVAGPEAPLPSVAAVAASLPPLLGALHVLPLFLLARRLLGRARARVGVAVYAVLPAAVTWSKFGHADHHVAEGLALLLLLLSCARAADEPDSTDGRAIGRAALAGLAVALGLFVWQGFVFAAVLAFAWAFFALAPVRGAALGVTAALATATGTALALAGEPQVPFSFVSFGWFQPLFVAAAALPLALRGALATKGRGPVRAATAVAAALLALAVLPNAARLAGAVLRGGSYVAARGIAGAGAGAEITGRSGGDDFDEATKGYLSYPLDLLAVIAEAQPLLARPLSRSLPAAVANLSPGLLALPWALFLWGRSGFRGLRSPRAGGRSCGRLLLALFGGALLAMTLSQRRNEYYLAIFASLALAEATVRAAHLLARRGPLRRLARAGPAPLSAAALLAGVLLVALPGRTLLAALPGYREAPGRDFLALLSRLQVAAPPPADPLALPGPAAGAWEGVFCPWTAGHFVTALSGRPAAADPNAYGWRRQCRLYTATDAAEAEAILREARCGWLLTVNLRPVLARYAAAAGRPDGTSPAESFAVRVHESTSTSPVPFLELLLDSRTATRSPDGRIVPAYRLWRVRTATGAGAAPSRDPAS